MAVVITRTPWIDDDGTGTTGTVLNNAMKTGLYNEIDTALAKVAQLAGGNAFTGNQAIVGNVNVTGNGQFVAAATGGVTVNLWNSAAGAGNYTSINIGNDQNFNAFALTTLSSTFASAADQQANGSTMRQYGAGGLSLSVLLSAPMRFYTNSAERMRIAATGEVSLNTAAILAAAKLLIGFDGTNSTGIGVYSMNAVGAAAAFITFLNNVGASQGSISGVSTTGVSYNTASDARLKTDAGRATDLSELRAVVVHDFTWKGDGIRDRGVFAQEAHDLYPRAVSRGDDETTESGGLAHPWMTDYSKFVPDLIVGWQQHDADLAELRALLATAKGSQHAE